jgi:hypothetical protein
MPNATRSRPHGFPEGTKAKTLLRSIGVLEGWLKQNEASAGKVRVQRMKRWRGEALQQLRLDLNRARP